MGNKVNIRQEAEKIAQEYDLGRMTIHLLGKDIERLVTRAVDEAVREALKNYQCRHSDYVKQL